MKTNLQQRKRFQKIAGLLNEEVDNTSPEEASKEAMKVASAIDKSPIADKIASDIKKDPKALQQLQNILKQAGINPNQLSEEVDSSLVKKLALSMAKKAEDSAINEEEGFDVGGAFWTGLIGGGTLAHYIFRKETFDVMGLAQYSAAMGETLAGAIVGAILAVVATKVYQSIKKNN
jgi:hypothetical protein